ncbi:MAG: hypothetical protein KGZ45_02865 [Clostridium sp.]|nr:hypothetical protein [Clostridium sp.]
MKAGHDTPRPEIVERLTQGVHCINLYQLSQIIYHLLIQRIVSVGGFVLPESAVFEALSGFVLFAL